MKAMILSAGMGSRMGSLTKKTPKPLLKIGNQTLLEIQLNKLIQAGICQFLINVSYLGDQIIEFVSNKYKNSSNLEIQFSEEDQPLETAGGIVNALEFFDNNPFLVTNADIFTNFDYSLLVKHKLSTDISAFLILVPNFLRQLIVDKTSSDSKTLLAIDFDSLIDPIKKLLIDIDLSGSTIIVFLKGKIFLFINKLNSLEDIYFTF